MSVEKAHVTSVLSVKWEKWLKVGMEGSEKRKRIERILGRNVIARQHKMNEQIVK